MRFSTPLRYPGGKGKLTNYLSKIIMINGLDGCEYVEPYAGGAGVAINLLLSGKASRIHLNDLNNAIFCFWRSILEETDQFCQLIEKTPVNMDEWYKNKNIISNQCDYSSLEVGFATFFLNRTNRSGILLGGVIGGKEQNGKWKIDARFNKVDLVNRIKVIADRKSDICIYNQDAKSFLQNTVTGFPLKTLLYLDPPYYVKGKGLYQNHYSHDDHVEIANIIKSNSKHPWIVSYDNTVEINNMYTGLRKIEYGISYSAQSRYQGPEVIFFCDSISIPDDMDPTRVKL
ncbi:DNA adenine methylase [Escherichia coli]|uniref:DNA adenine methylase n=5 Tax=Escherichia coli TaxID=562 RepID=UPI0003913ACF|nr:DNA adenine methylase [Escherichia coli]EFN6743984.1 DNA adenine methylase [Escherichia coli O6]EFO1264179.1 DNA adenine methylase [Escherichia albertii]HCC76378.1 DNA adenine methylase [Shigella sp.]AZU83417.1 DNA adenine methylase [Escherichia coli]EEU9175328.1 DNA adenine methylase [Escherichia coli]